MTRVGRVPTSREAPALQFFHENSTDNRTLSRREIIQIFNWIPCLYTDLKTLKPKYGKMDLTRATTKKLPYAIKIFSSS